MRFYEYANEPCLHSLTPAQRSTGCQSHVDLIGYKVVCDVRNTSDFKPWFWDRLWLTSVLKRQYSAMVWPYEFTHGLS